MTNDSPKVAVITGAAQGIGQRTALLLAERGYALALLDLRPPDETRRAAEAHGAPALALVGDVAAAAAVLRFAAEVEARWGGPTCSTTTPASA
jgi:NAD(P)-dependent dehydrogenase (short-subunit alcohol dehydrogenase family)